MIANLKNRILMLMALSILPLTASATDLVLMWDPVVTATDGAAISPDFISYRVYEETDGLIISTDETEASWTNAELRCYTFWVTAYRSDSDLESVPSNSVSKCIDEDTDDQIRLLIPVAPTITIQTKLGQQ